MAKAWKVKGVKPKKSYRWNAQVILPIKIGEVYSWAEAIRDPTNIKELHDMRISVKRLRYSMEFFGINYGEEFIDLLKVTEDLQELLGDIHDYDVIDEVLTNSLQNLPEAKEAETDAIGINALISRYRKMRKTTYEAFLQKWDELEQTGFKERFLKIIKGQ